MFEHCWEITLRGSMLRRLPARLPRLGRLAPPAPLRQRPAPRRAARDQRRARADGLALRARAARPARAARRVRGPACRSRGTTPTSPGRPCRPSGTTSAAACRPPGTPPRHPVNRAADVALAGVGLVVLQPDPRRRGRRGQARGRRPDPLPAATGREGRRGLRAAEAPLDGRRRRAEGRRLRGRPRRCADHAGRALPATDVDRRAAAALERRARRHVGDRPPADAPLPGRAVHGAAAQAARRPSRPHGLGPDPRPRDAAVGRPDRARRLVRRAPLAARRPEDPRCGPPLALFGGTYRGSTGGWRAPN